MPEPELHADTANNDGDGLAYTLAAAAEVLDGCVESACDRLFARLSADAAGTEVLAWMTASERARIGDRHREHLGLLLAPATTDRGLSEMGYRAGWTHALIGIEPAWFVDALGDFVGCVKARTDGWATPAARAAVEAAVAERALTYVRAHLLGHHEVDSAATTAAATLLDVTRAATTVTDLIQATLATLAALPGFAVGYFGRPNRDGAFEFEIAAGESVEAFLGDLDQGSTPRLTTSASSAAGLGPAGRAWRTGDIVRSDSYTTDPSTAMWRHVGEKYGLRASAAVPLRDAYGQAYALLSLYAHSPGYFAQQSRAHLLEQVRGLVESALMRLPAEQQTPRRATGVAQRSRYRDLLHDGSVTLVYQPIIDLHSGELVRWEGLARLCDGGERLVSPDEFLPTFGEEELTRLFEVGLDRALTTLGDWQRQGMVTQVSVNLPPTSAPGDWYVSLVDDALGRANVDPARLTLEILEHDPIGKGPTDQGHGLAAVRALGVRLAEDDLGSAYSSLIRMRQITFDEVKIERELVRDAEHNAQDALGFIYTLTTLAHHRGMTVTVEGLESPALVEAAATLGADLGQGYGISRPMAAGAAPTWAANWRPEMHSGTSRTALGALAGHLAWECGLTTQDPGARRRDHAGDACPLTVYLASLGTPADAAHRVHRELHDLALEALGSPEHRDAWATLARLLHTTFP